MLIVGNMNHVGVKMLKRRNNRLHKIHHLKEAKKIRFMAKEMHNMGLISDKDLQEAEFSAIAEENCRNEQH